MNPRRTFFTLTLFALALLAGCASGPEQPADVVIRDAHSGGSTLATSPDSQLAASGGWSGWIRIWNLADGSPRSAWRAHNDSVNGLLFLDDGGLLSAGYDGRIAFWTLDGHLEAELDAGSPVTAFAASPTAHRMATGHLDGKVRLWNLTGERLGEWTPHSSTVRAVALSGDGLRLASSGTDGKVEAWRTDDGPKPFEAPPSDARTLAFSPDGNSLYGGGWFQLFRWTMASGKLEILPTDHGGIINSIRFMNDGRLASISRQTDSAVLLLDPSTGHTLERLQRHDLCGVAVAPSPDGHHLVTTSDDSSVRIWHLAPASRTVSP